MTPTAWTVVGLLVAIGMGTLAYLVSGLIGWGKASEQIKNTVALVTEIKSTMLSRADLKLTVMEMQQELVKGLRAEFYSRAEAEALEKRLEARDNARTQKGS